MPPRKGMLSGPAMPSKFTSGAETASIPALAAAERWTAASPANPRSAGTAPRSRSWGTAPALAACLATSRMGAETSKPAGAVNVGLALWAAAGAAGGALWAVPTGAETSRPVTSSSGTSSRARLLRVHILTVTPFPLAVRPDGRTLGSPELPGQRSGVDVGALAGRDQLTDVVAGARREDRVA